MEVQDPATAESAWPGSTHTRALWLGVTWHIQETEWELECGAEGKKAEKSRRQLEEDKKTDYSGHKERGFLLITMDSQCKSVH